VSTTVSNYISKIDQAYPIAGQDNDSQGFRDNFKNIYQALYYVDEDLTQLKNSNVSKLSETNDFSRNTILRANFQDCSTQILDNTDTVTGDVIVDYSQGSYQTFVLDSGEHTVNIDNWPGELKSGSITLVFSTSTTATTYVDFGGYVTNVGSTPLPVEIVNSPAIFELWSDGAAINSYYVRQISNQEETELAASGYQKFDSGLTMQWGNFNITFASTGTTSTTVTFTRPFGTAVGNVTLTANTSTPQTVIAPSFTNLTTSSFVAWAYSSVISTVTYHYSALGF
jgi:hypothetical protein